MINVVIFNRDVPEGYVGKFIDCYEKETQETYWRTVENFVHSWGDMYELKITKTPAYEYNYWCNQGTEHTKEEMDDKIIYTRKMLMEDAILISFANEAEFIKFLEEYSPLEVVTDKYFLLDGTPIIGVESVDYNDYD